MFKSTCEQYKPDYFNAHTFLEKISEACEFFLKIKKQVIFTLPMLSHRMFFVIILTVQKWFLKETEFLVIEPMLFIKIVKILYDWNLGHF